MEELSLPPSLAAQMPISVNPHVHSIWAQSSEEWVLTAPEVANTGCPEEKSMPKTPNIFGAPYTKLHLFSGL